MPECPDGLTPGFGVGKTFTASICLLKTDFGVVDGARRLRTGSGMLFKTAGNSSFVVTAGHNIYHHDLDRTARAITLWFGSKGDSMAAQREARDFKASLAFVAAITP